MLRRVKVPPGSAGFCHSRRMLKRGIASTMDLERNKRQARLSWLVLGGLGVLSGLLALLQYRWLGEVSFGERERMRAGLNTSLSRLSQDFNTDLTTACGALLSPVEGEGDETGEAIYAARYAVWKENSHHAGLFKRVMLIVPKEDGVELRDLDLEQAVFRAGQWPANWKRLQERFESFYAGEGPRRGPGPPPEFDDGLIEIPRFGRFGQAGGPPPPPPPDREREGGSGRNRDRERDRERRERPRGGGPGPGFIREWVVLETDLDYVRDTMLKDLVNRHLGDSQYRAEVVSRNDPGRVILPLSGPIGAKADSSVGIFDVQWEQIARRAGLFRGFGGGGGGGGGFRRNQQPPDRSRWQLQVQHRAGSLEAVVSKARWRNLAVSMAILLVMLATAVAMVRVSQRAQSLAQLQMDFVAGVSHELRTPLAVIRTAAHNLESGKLNTDKIQRYGKLISDESDRLTGIVEQVLRFAAAKAGKPVAVKEVVAPGSLIEEALRATERTVAQSGCTLERSIGEHLPPVLADPIAIRHAIQNLVVNAAKYGAEGKWIGVTAETKQNGNGTVVEIRVADHGPGIPAGEIRQVFDPFYRGKRAIEEQIHGTGLGLNLVKRIMEAHEGSVDVESEPGKGTEFVLRIPAAPEEKVDEFANTTG